MAEDTPVGFSGIRILQTLSELDDFINLIVEYRCTSYLEIGAHHGDTLYRVGEALPDNSTLVGIDLPGATAGNFKDSGVNLTRACQALNHTKGHTGHVYLGDSTTPEAVAFAKRYGPYDVVFIDGSHAYDDVYKDWENYGAMGSLVAFHDINKVGGKWNGGVHDLWQQLKKTHRTVEFSARPDKRGIGVLWKN